MWWKKRFSILTTTLLLLTMCANAQERYHLRDLVNIALEENYQIQIVRNDARMAENRNNPGEAGMLPTVGIAADHNTDAMTSRAKFYTGAERTGTNAVSTRSQALAELHWTVFDGFTMFARRDKLGHLAAMSESDTRFFIEQTVGDLTHSYYLLIREILLLETYRKISEVSSFRLRLEEQRREVGSGSTLHYNQALLDYHADSVLVIQQQLRITEQQIRINKILNQPSQMRPYPADTTLVVKGLPPMQQLLEQAQKNNPEMELARISEMVAEAENRIARGGRMPQIDLFSHYAFSRQTSETGIIESAVSRGAQIGVRIRFNLYDGGKQKTLVQNAAIARESSAIAKADIKVSLENQLALLVAQYTSLASQKHLLAKSREAADRTLDIAYDQLRNGAISGFEFRLAQISVLNMEQQLVDIDYALISIETDMHRICGMLTATILNQTP